MAKGEKMELKSKIQWGAGPLIEFNGNISLVFAYFVLDYLDKEVEAVRKATTHILLVYWYIVYER